MYTADKRIDSKELESNIDRLTFLQEKVADTDEQKLILKIATDTLKKIPTDALKKEKYLNDICNAESYQIPTEHTDTIITYKGNNEQEVSKLFSINLNEVTRYVSFRIIKNNSKKCTCHITHLYLQQAFQRKGIGTKLLDVITQEAQDQGCDKITLWSVDSAISFYEKNGFHKVNAPDCNMKKYI
ncbi:MAG: GNAT family N-acetyltransferase [Candidatus Chromulinivorax sp.]